METTFQHSLCQRILHTRLDGTAQRTRTVYRIEAILGQFRDSGIGNLQMHIHTSHTLIQRSDHPTSDIFNIRLRQLMEHHDVIHTV